MAKGLDTNAVAGNQLNLARSLTKSFAHEYTLSVDVLPTQVV
jgi:hypothetical protein